MNSENLRMLIQETRIQATILGYPIPRSRNLSSFSPNIVEKHVEAITQSTTTIHLAYITSENT